LGSVTERAPGTGPSTVKWVAGTVDIVPILRQVVAGLDPLARERQVVIEIDCR
jgi:hypothetical protein